mgnify:CR=1 FL=1
MHAMCDDGRLQIVAGTRLLEFSGLVQWDSVNSRFICIAKHEFEQSWQSNLDPDFGRLISWIMFSAGAEFLAKGVCLVNGIEFRKEQQVPDYPSGSIQGWASKVQDDWHACGTIETTNFGMLGDLTAKESKKKISGPLRRLCDKSKAAIDQRALLLSAYTLLHKTIRNRDVHAYVPNVRSDHHSVVSELFCPCFKLLMGWLPGGAQILNDWRGDHASFLAQL